MLIDKQLLATIDFHSRKKDYRSKKCFLFYEKKLGVVKVSLLSQILMYSTADLLLLANHSCNTRMREMMLTVPVKGQK